MEPQTEELSRIEAAIEALNNPALLSKNPQIKSEAEALLGSFAEEHAFSCADFLKILAFSSSLHTQYWALTVMGQLLTKDDYYVQHYSQSKREEINEAIQQLLESHVLVLSQERLILTKFAQIYVLLLNHDYPEIWKSPFSFLLHFAQKQSEKQIAFTQLLVAVLAILDDEVVRLRSDRKDERATKIKDTMRDTQIPALSEFLTSLLQHLAGSLQEHPQPSLLKDTLKAVEGLIDWNNVELFTNTLAPLNELLSSPDYRTPALRCLHSLIKKGMDYKLKYELISSLDILNTLTHLVQTAQSETEESGFPSAVAQLVQTIGIIAVEALSLQQHNQLDEKPDFLNLLQPSLTLALKCISSGNPYLGRDVCDFLNHYLHLKKKEGQQLNDELPLFETIFSTLIAALEYPEWHESCLTLSEDDLSLQEEDYNELRDSLQVVFISLVSIKGYYEIAVQHIGEMIETLHGRQEEAGPRKMELIISLIFWIAETKAVSSNFKQGIFIQPFAQLLSLDVAAGGFPLSLNRLLDCFRKYIEFFQSRPQYLEQILSHCLSEKGAMNSNHKLASRSVITFLRFQEVYRAQIGALASTFMPVLTKLIDEAEEGRYHLKTDDLGRLYQIQSAFLLDSSAFSDEQKMQTVLHIFEKKTKTLQQAGNSVTAQRAIQTLVSVAKAFKPTAITPQISEVFTYVAKVVLQAYSTKYSSNDEIRDLVFQTINILLIPLGAAILEDLKVFISLLFDQVSQHPSIIDRLLNLSSYICSHIGEAASNFQMDFYQALSNYVASIELDPSAPKSDTSERLKIDILCSFFKMTKQYAIRQPFFLLSLNFQELLEKASSFALGNVPPLIRKTALVFLNVVLNLFIPTVDKKKEPVKAKVSRDEKSKEWELVATTALNISIKTLTAIDGTSPQDLILNIQECVDMQRTVASTVQFSQFASAAHDIFQSLGVEQEQEARILQELHKSLVDEKKGRGGYTSFLKTLLKKS